VHYPFEHLVCARNDVEATGADRFSKGEDLESLTPNDHIHVNYTHTLRPNKQIDDTRVFKFSATLA